MVYLVIVIGLILIYGTVTYNKFIKSQELVKNARAQIAAQIESRWDALSNLISATSKYSAYEAEVITNTVKNRQQLNSASSTGSLEESESTYQSSLSRLIAVSENYPDLKASEVYKSTMASVNKYESNVRLSRMTFNDTVTKYNRLIKVFPANIVANIAGFSQEGYLETSEGKKEMPGWN